MAVTLNASNSGTGGLSVTSDATGNLAFQTAGTTAVTVDTSQNATFAGTASATKLIPTGSSATGNGLYLPAANSLGLSTNGTNAVYIDSSQNVGIGTTSPTATLHVRPTTDVNLRVTNSSTALNLSAENNAGSAQVAMKFNGSQMMLTSSGNLLVGTTSDTPAGSGDTKGISLNSSGSSSQIYATGNGDTCAVFNRAGSDGATVRLRRQGTDVGSISVTGSATAYNTSSDYRLKNTITPMTGALTKVAQLKPVTYKWNIDGSDGEGFIAHELAEVCPHAVVGEKDAVDKDGNPEYQGIDTSFLVATLTAAIQELKAINDTQAATITALTARIVALEK